MNRRETIKTMMAASGALIALPSWAQGWSTEEVSRHVSSLGLESQETLSAVADTIIPAGNSVGALAVEVDKFLQRLFDDCYEQNVQENINTQLIALENSARGLYNRSFKECDQHQREALLNALALSEIEAESEFFKLVKSETIRGYITSREVMVNHLKYQQVPGHYFGCVDATA